MKPSHASEEAKTHDLGIVRNAQTPEATNKMSEFVAKLSSCRSLEGIQRLAASLGVDLRSSQRCSKLIMQHLLEKKYGLGSTLQFLEDSSLNAAGSENLSYFLRWYVGQPLDVEDNKLLHIWIKRQVSSGILSEKELLHLVKTASFINRSLGSETTHSGYSRTIFEGLESSTVIGVRDVDGSVLNELLESIASRSLSWEEKLLGFAIVKSSTARQLRRNMAPSISSFLKCFLLPQKRQRNVQEFDIDAVSQLLCMLRRAPINVAFTCIAGASRALLSSRGHDSVPRMALLECLHAWWSVLVRHKIFRFLSSSEEWLEFERIIAHQSPDILNSYLHHLPSKQQCSFLQRNWFAPGIGNKSTYHNVRTETTPFQKDLPIPTTRVSPFITMLQSLGPKFPSNSRKIRRLFSLLREDRKSLTVLEIANNIQPLKLPIPVTAIVREIAEQSISNPHIAFRLFKCTPNIPLEACPAVAEIMIRNPRFNPSTALRYRLDRQKSLTPPPQPFRPAPANILATSWKGFPSSHEHPQIRQARARLLERMALAYAQATHLYPSVAFRNVRRCYRLHKWHCLGPVGVDMSRALVLAGGVRQLEDSRWVSTERFRWVLEVVRKVEGDEVAGEVADLVYRWGTEVVKELGNRARTRRDLGLPALVRERAKRPRGKTLGRWMEKEGKGLRWRKLDLGGEG